jgi:hypothetical protein
VSDLAAKAKTERRGADRQTKRALDTPWIQLLMRFGYVVRGVVYGLIGALALAEALGLPGRKTDPKGTLAVIAGVPSGGLLLTVIVIGLAGYAIWCFACALFDPLRHRSDAAGLARRLAFVAAGLGDLALLVFAVGVLGGQGPGADGPQRLVEKALQLPIGQPLVVAAGVIVVVVGLGQFVSGARAGFEHDLDERKMNKPERVLSANLGRAGYAARGLVYTLIGWFTIDGGLNHDPGRAKGFGGAFSALEGRPFGHYLLAAVALGFIALGAHSLACARWIRMLVR